MHQEFDPRDLEPSLPPRAERSTRSKLAPIMIAAVALTGFGGVVWYAYDQGIRQSTPSGATPLIKADNSPTKVRPDQPGGMDVPHQDKLVLNNLEGNKPGSPQIERLLPPPETPLPRPAPTAQAPVMAPVMPPPQSLAQTAPATGAGLPPKIGPTPAAPPSSAAPSAPAQTAAVAPPPPAGAPRDAVQTSGSSGSTSAPTAPATKPTQVAAAPAATPKPAEKPAAKTVPAAAPSATGGFKVQLVSVKAEGDTKSEWARLQHTYPQLAPLKMSVTRVDLGEKGIWYRIFAGPLSDAGAAGDLCNGLKAKGQGCVVVKP